MKVLLDENLPHDLRHFIPGHELVTVAFMGWAGLQNGALLSAAAKSGFGAMISRDANLAFQQNTATLPLSVIVVPAHAAAVDDLLPYIPAILEALARTPTEKLIRIAK